LAAIVSVTLPSPVPLVGAIVIQEAPDVAVHAQPAVVVTLTVDVLAVAATDAVVGATVKLQGAAACVTVTV
jgi:hypothetical protein